MMLQAAHLHTSMALAADEGIVSSGPCFGIAMWQAGMDAVQEITHGKVIFLIQ
jgi:hypothetical protein